MTEIERKSAGLVKFSPCASICLSKHIEMLLSHRIAGIEVLTEVVEATETVAPRAIAIVATKGSVMVTGTRTEVKRAK